MVEHNVAVIETDSAQWEDAIQWAGAFIAGFCSAQITAGLSLRPRMLVRVLRGHEHPFRGLRRTHLDLYLRILEVQDPPPAGTTVYRRISTINSWFRWLEDDEAMVGNPAARVRRPQRHPTPRAWLNRRAFDTPADPSPNPPLDREARWRCPVVPIRETPPAGKAVGAQLPRSS